MANAQGVMVRPKSGGPWQYFAGAPEFTVQAFGPDTALEICPVGAAIDLTTLEAAAILSALPGNLVAGQQATLAFSEAPDDVDIIQGGVKLSATVSGEGKIYTFVPPTTQALIVAALKADFAPYTGTFTVQPAPPVLVVTSGNEFQIDNLDADSAPEPFALALPAEDAGTRPIDPTAMLDGPAPHIQPTYTRDGDEFVIDPRVWTSLAGPVQFEYEHLRDGQPIPGANQARYTKQAADAGKTLSARITGVDGRGDTAITLPGIGVPAAGLPNAWTDLGFFANYSPNSSLVIPTKTLPIALGPADPAKKLIIVAQTGSDYSPTFSLIVGDVEYPLEKIASQTPQSFGRQNVLLEIDMPLGGDAVLKSTATGNVSWQTPLLAHVFAAKGMARVGAPTTARVTMAAGTPVAVTAATQTGDVALMTMVSVPNAAGGIFDGSALVTELTDHQHAIGTPYQFWVGAGVETAGNAARTISVTPNAAGNAARINAIYRSV